MTRRLNNIDNESDHISFINRSFTALIKESTYPVVIQWFKNFDKRVMMPFFKRHFKAKEHADENID